MTTESEIQLCHRLRDWAERLGFEVYPEVQGWDLVLVATKPTELQRHSRQIIATGEQVGIHAKLRANCDVLVQALPPPGAGIGYSYPHHPFVAVPSPGEGFQILARRFGIGVIATDGQRRRRQGWPVYGSRIYGDATEPTVRSESSHAAGEHEPLKLPPIASRCIVAGAPSPRVLSEWRVSALRFLTFARQVETFTAAQLQGFGLGKSWVDRWGEPVDWTTETRRGKTVRIRTYRLTARAEALPDWGYKDVAAELAAVQL